MAEIDIKAITEETIQKMGGTREIASASLFKRYQQNEINYDPEKIRQRLIFLVWHKCLLQLSINDKNADPLAPEKTISLMIKKGLPKESVTFRKDSFRIKMANSQYRFYKSGDGFYACPWPSAQRAKILVSENSMADFIFLFDSEIPYIESRVPELLEFFRKRELEKQKKRMETQIMHELIQSLIDQYLKPLGLSANYSLLPDGKVAFKLTKLLTGHLEIPLEQLAEKLKDKSFIVNSLDSSGKIF